MTESEYDMAMGRLIRQFTVALVDTLSECINNTSQLDKDNIDCNEVVHFTTAAFVSYIISGLNDEPESYKHLLKMHMSAVQSAIEQDIWQLKDIKNA